MEEKKDINSLIGFTLMGAVMLLWLWTQPPIEENLIDEITPQQEIEKSDSLPRDNIVNDKTIDDKINNNYFNESVEIADKSLSFENELLSLEINPKGGFISKLFLKNYKNYLEKPIYLINEDNSEFNLNFNLEDNNKPVNSKNLYFSSSSNTDNDDNLIITMRHTVSNDKFLEYKYVIKPNDYMIDFSINSSGLSNVVNTQSNYELTWDYKSLRNSKSISYENRYTRLTYEFEDSKIEKLGGMGGTSDDEELVSELNWFSYRQHFFSAILLATKPLDNVSLSQTNLSLDEDIDTLYTKNYISKIPLSFTNREFNEKFQFYFGPTDSKILSEYDKNLESSIPFGWGIFGYINKSIFIPLFSYLSSIFPYGIAIIFMTILVRLVLSPVLYKSYLSQAKMKILKPEINEIALKYKDNAMKKQQETMALYNKAGANPMSGCLPALIQIPVFYALFMFFPTAFDLRRKSFLWAEDLSSYDNILDLPFNIPFYGDHVSLFPILASIAIFFYMKMTTGQQMSQQPTQEGMPDMGKMMKYMIYFSPVLMLVFFNNYASGLSLYYFISNLITIAIMLVIKNYILDENKIHAQIELNKAKPQKKPGRFQKKMKQLMEEAERQKRAQNRN